MINVPQLVHWAQYYLGKVTIRSATKEELKGVLLEYKQHLKVFSKKESQWLSNYTVWDRVKHGSHHG
jgi:hypothetical protein